MPTTSYCVERGRWVYTPTASERIRAVLLRITRHQTIPRTTYERVVSLGIEKWSRTPAQIHRLQTDFRAPSDAIGFRRGLWVGGLQDKEQVAKAAAECERDGRQRVPDFKAERLRLARRELRRADELSAIVRRAERLIKQRKTSK